MEHQPASPRNPRMRAARDRQHRQKGQHEIRVPCQCPHCGEPLQVAASLAGGKVRCPACQGEMAIPRQFANPPRPSAAFGYLVAGLVTLPAVLGVFLLAARYRATPRTWVWVVVFSVFLGIAHAVNRYRRYRPGGRTETPPIAHEPSREDPAPPSVRPVAAPEPQRASTRPAVAAKVARVMPVRRPKGERTAGRWESDRFVLTRGEIADILGKPERFDNVLVAEERVIGGLRAEIITWRLTLARGAAVAVSGQSGQVWSVMPQDVELKGRWQWGPGFLVLIQSTDGRTQQVSMSYEDQIALLAWQSATIDKFASAIRAHRFLRKLRHVPGPWLLLAWSLNAGKDTSGWLRFRLPYTTVSEGLQQLCSRPDELRATAEAMGPAAVAEWPRKADPDDRATIEGVLGPFVQGKIRSRRRLGLGLVIVGVALPPVLFFAEKWGGSPFPGDAAMLSLAVCVPTVIVGAAFLVQARWLRRTVSTAASSPHTSA